MGNPIPNPCRLRPLSDHVVVQPTEAAAMTAGGLVIPETAKEKPMQGTVLAVGPGRVEPGIGTILPTILPAVAVGDVVLFGRYAGTEVMLDDVRVLILREEDLLGILAAPTATGRSSRHLCSWCGQRCTSKCALSEAEERVLQAREYILTETITAAKVRPS